MTISILKSLLTILILVYFGLGALLYFFQQHFIYFPSTEIVDGSQRSLKIKSDNETLNVWLLNPDNKEAVIYFGGNAQNVYFAIPQFKQMIPDKTVYLVDYRGYGSSSGRPSEQGLYIDAINIYDHIKKLHDNVSVIGQSLGSGVATHLATKREIHKLVLSTPYDSIEAVAKSNYPFYPISMLLKEKYDSMSRVASITSQTLMIIAANDRIIPKKHAYKLAGAFNPDYLTVIEVPKTGHNTLSQHAQYEREISEFLK